MCGGRELQTADVQMLIAQGPPASTHTVNKSSAELCVIQASFGSALGWIMGLMDGTVLIQGSSAEAHQAVPATLCIKMLLWRSLGQPTACSTWQTK